MKRLALLLLFLPSSALAQSWAPPMAPPGKGIDCRQFEPGCWHKIFDTPTPGSGSGFSVTYKGKTALSYNGSQSGYDGADDLCNANYSGSHVCQTAEILRLVQTTHPTADQGWINMGPPGSHLELNNDCNGWHTTSSVAYARQWSFAANAVGGRGLYTPCNSSLSYLCCSVP